MSIKINQSEIRVNKPHKRNPRLIVRVEKLLDDGTLITQSFSIAIDNDFSINMVVPTFILVGEEILNYDSQR